MTKADVEALPGALRHFNGIYSDSGQFVIENPIRILVGLAIGALLLLIALGVLIYRFIRRRRNRRAR